MIFDLRVHFNVWFMLNCSDRLFELSKWRYWSGRYGPICAMPSTISSLVFLLTMRIQKQDYWMNIIVWYSYISYTWKNIYTAKIIFVNQANTKALCFELDCKCSDTSFRKVNLPRRRQVQNLRTEPLMSTSCSQNRRPYNTWTNWLECIC